MGFQITALTPVPLNPDGTQDGWTWGELGGPFSVPASEGAGLGAEVLTSNDVNYEWQHGGRWTRALRDRVVFSDEGLFASCVVSQGAWNINGGTLDITLGATRLVVDVDGNGGTVIEIRAALASPETLAANTDNYVDLDEAGGYAVASVPNGDPEPAVTPGMVRVFVLTTDATELVSTGLAPGVAPFPCLGPVVGALDLQAVAATVSTLTSSIVTRKTHADTGGWEDGFSPSWRTFAVSGAVPAGTFDVPLTSSSPDDSRELFTGIPADCVVSFTLDITSVIGEFGGNMSASFGLVNVDSTSGKITLTRVAGSYTQVNDNTSSDFNGLASTFTIVDVAGEAVLRVFYDFSTNPFRTTIEAKLSLVTLNP